MFIPWFGVATFGLELIVRIFQWVWLAQHHHLPHGVGAQSIWILGSDALVAVGVGVVLDGVLPWLKAHTPPRWRRIWSTLQWLLFGLLLVFLAATVKFYTLFESFFNYGHWTQVDRLGAYWKNILSELDLWAVLGGAFLAGYAGLTHACRVRFPQLRSAPRTRLIVLTGLGGFLLLTNLPWHTWPPQQAWRALDENPILALASFFHPDALPSAPRRQWSATSPRPAAQSTFLTDLPLAERQKLNVMVLLLESMTPDYAGITQAENRAYLPQLTQLAGESLVFPNHYCQEPASLKSLFTILTGRYSYSTRNWNAFIARAQGDPSLAERLKTRGYATAFLTSANGRTYSQNAFLRPRVDHLEDMTTLQAANPALRKFSDSVDDRALVEALDRYLKKQNGQKFFVMVSPYFPHHPYPIPAPEFKVTPGNTPYERYQNSIHFADALTGQLIEVLKHRGVWENTLLVVVSDHGEAFQQHPGNFLHSIFLYEENVRTVFLLHQPRLLKPGTDLRLTAHTDIAPTVLDLLGYPASDFDGVSTLAPPLPTRPVFFYTTFNDARWGVREQNQKYILTQRHRLEELYDLSVDPGEHTNLADRYPESCARFREELARLAEKVR